MQNVSPRQPGVVVLPLAQKVPSMPPHPGGRGDWRDTDPPIPLRFIGGPPSVTPRWGVLEPSLARVGIGAPAEMKPGGLYESQCIEPRQVWHKEYGLGRDNRPRLQNIIHVGCCGLLNVMRAPNGAAENSPGFQRISENGFSSDGERMDRHGTIHSVFRGVITGRQSIGTTQMFR